MAFTETFENEGAWSTQIAFDATTGEVKAVAPGFFFENSFFARFGQVKLFS